MMDGSNIVTWAAPIAAALLTCAGQLWLNQRFKRADEKRDSARAETDAKRAAEAEWRKSVDRLLGEQGEALKSVADDRVDWYAWREAMVGRMDEHDDRIAAVLESQCTQMRSDITHKIHRYLDDLHAASTEEKQSLFAEYEVYCNVCNKYGIKNHFVEKLIQQVMELPDRD